MVPNQQDMILKEHRSSKDQQLALHSSQSMQPKKAHMEYKIDLVHHSRNKILLEKVPLLHNKYHILINMSRVQQQVFCSSHSRNMEKVHNSRSFVLTHRSSSSQYLEKVHSQCCMSNLKNRSSRDPELVHCSNSSIRMVLVHKVQYLVKIHTMCSKFSKVSTH